MPMLLPAGVDVVSDLMQWKAVTLLPSRTSGCLAAAGGTVGADRLSLVLSAGGAAAAGAAAAGRSHCSLPPAPSAGVAVGAASSRARQSLSSMSSATFYEAKEGVGRQAQASGMSRGGRAGCARKYEGWVPLKERQTGTVSFSRPRVTHL